MLQLRLCVTLCLLTLTPGGEGQRAINQVSVQQISVDEVQYLDFAVKTVRSFFGDRGEDLPTSIHLVGASAQMVAGVRYEFYFVVTSPNDQVSVCQASVWVRPWLSAEYITQLDDPVTCGLPASVVTRLEQTFNDHSDNNLKYARVVGQPANITVQDAALRVEDVPLAETTCRKRDAMAGQHCDVSDDAKPKFHCSARLVWTGLAFAVSDFSLRSQK